MLTHTHTQKGHTQKLGTFSLFLVFKQKSYLYDFHTTHATNIEADKISECLFLYEWNFKNCAVVFWVVNTYMCVCIIYAPNKFLAVFTSCTYRDIPYDPKNNNSLLERMLLMSSSYTCTPQEQERAFHRVRCIKFMWRTRVVEHIQQPPTDFSTLHLIYKHTHTRISKWKSRRWIHTHTHTQTRWLLEWHLDVAPSKTMDV